MPCTLFGTSVLFNDERRRTTMDGCAWRGRVRVQAHVERLVPLLDAERARNDAVESLWRDRSGLRFPISPLLFSRPHRILLRVCLFVAVRCCPVVRIGWSPMVCRISLLFICF